MSKSKYKPIGFEVTDSKENIFKIMLQSITDFTISKSTSSIYYQNKQGKILRKSFFKQSHEGYYINGSFGNLFKTFKKKDFEENKAAIYIPSDIANQMLCYTKKTSKKTIKQMLFALENKFIVQSA